MDFFALQDDAFARSRKFYLAFGLAIVLAVAILYLAVSGSLGFLLGLPASVYGYPAEIFSLRPFLMVGSVIAIIILFISVRRTSFIRNGGGAYIAELLDARLLETPANSKETQLINVVEEMAVAAGLPRPRIYVIPGPRSINAITAGVDYEDAVIAVTEGAVNHLNRDEMQGVIAHEFAHILNGDYSLNLTMAGWLYGLMFFYIQGRRILSFVSAAADSLVKDMAEKNNHRHGTSGCLMAVPAIITGGFLMAGGWVGKTLAQIIQAAFSRQREHLADAFAVQFTRNPRGLAGALKKIAWVPRRGFIRSEDALTVQAFFIASPAKLNSLFQSHPPLEERIQILDPAWDGRPAAIDHDDFRLPKDFEAKYGYGPAALPGCQKAGGLRTKAAAKIKKMDGWSGVLVLSLLQADSDGLKIDDSLKAAHGLYAEIPLSLREAADDVNEAPVLAASVFVHSEAELKRRQKLVIEKRLGEAAAAKALAFKSRMLEEHRLPLLGLISPTLKALTQEDQETLSRLIKNLVAVDGKLDLFEIAACQILKKSFGGFLSAGKSDQKNEAKTEPGNYNERVKREVATVMSLLSALDSKSESEAQGVFSSAMAAFNQWPPQKMLPRHQISSKVLVNSLDFLTGAPLKIRKSLVKAAASACLSRESMTGAHYQLLRALAAAVDVPLPLIKAEEGRGD